MDFRRNCVCSAVSYFSLPYLQILNLCNCVLHYETIKKRKNENHRFRLVVYTKIINNAQQRQTLYCCRTHSIGVCLGGSRSQNGIGQQQLSYKLNIKWFVIKINSYFGHSKRTISHNIIHIIACRFICNFSCYSQDYRHMNFVQHMFSRIYLQCNCQ